MIVNFTKSEDESYTLWNGDTLDVSYVNGTVTIYKMSVDISLRVPEIGDVECDIILNDKYIDNEIHYDLLNTKSNIASMMLSLSKQIKNGQINVSDRLKDRIRLIMLKQINA